MASASLQPLTQVVQNGAVSDNVRARLEQAQHEVHLYQERLEMLLMTSGDGLWDWNLRTDELYVSDRWYQIVGEDQRTKNNNVSAVWLSAIHADDLDHVMRAIYGHLSGETVRFEVEYRVICGNGEARWVHSRGIARNDERGQPQRMVGSHRDIGERKRQEDRIRESQDIIRRNEERFRAMIENGSDLITLVDTAGVITYQSPSVLRTLGYSVEELIGINITDLLHPEDRASIRDRVGKETDDAAGIFTAQLRARHKDGNYRWMEITAKIRSTQIAGSQLVLNSRDITDRVEATMLLEREVAKRTRELQTLLTINRTVSSTLDLSSLLETILDTAGAVVEYDVVKLFELDESAHKLRLLKHRGHHTQEELRAFESWDLNAFDLQVIASRKPTIIRDTEAEYARMGDVRSISSDRPSTPSRVRSWMCLPLIVRDRVLGIMTFDNSQPGYYSEQLSNIAMAFASQAAAAIENARLYSAEQMRLKVAEGMREQVRLLNSNITRAEVFKRVLQQVSNAFLADGAAIYELDRETQMLEIRDSFGIGQTFVTRHAAQMGAWQIGRAVTDRTVHADELARLAADTSLPEERQALVQALSKQERFTWTLTIPLISDREVYGGVVLCYRAKQRFDSENLSLAATIGYQSALGIENARLREEAAKSAIASERYRLARELHDSVSQALYGISLGARTAKQIIATESPRGTDAVDYVLSLAEGGLAEMRALILELRPESLTTEGLVVVLQKQMAALSARHKFELDTRFCDEPSMPIQHKEALYRITMEATQNVIKHAQATRVGIDMSVQPDTQDRRRVVIVLRDNGKGFDMKRSFPGHMGLINMRERAESAGGTFELTSVVGEGTQIHVTMPLPHDGQA